MNRLIINDLCIEVTRRCVMKCAHCMRGEAQNINLQLDKINQLFNNNSSDIIKINRLALTGREPTLNSEAIIKIVSHIINQNIKLNAFVMVTNGSNYNQKIINILNLLYRYYLENKDKNGFNLICSLDQFHKSPSQETLEKYIRLPYFIHNRITINNNDIICLGRAYENSLGNPKSYYYQQSLYQQCLKNNLPIIYKYKTGKISIDKLYLNARGLYGFHIIDATYDMIDSLCTYDQQQIEKMLTKRKTIN